MKVLQISPRYPPHTGGVETHVKEISERLVERDHEVTVVTADAGPDVRNREQRNGVEVRRCRGFSRDGSFHIAPSVALVVRKADVDIVHAHNYHSLPLLFAAMGVTDERFVVTPHYHGGSASPVRAPRPRSRPTNPSRSSSTTDRPAGGNDALLSASADPPVCSGT